MSVNLTDPVAFRLWWQRRDLLNDGALVREAEELGLIRRGNGMLILTEKGKALRDQHPCPSCARSRP